MIDNVKRFPQVYKYRSFKPPSSIFRPIVSLKEITLTKATLKGKQLHFILDLLKHGCRNLSNTDTFTESCGGAYVVLFLSFFFLSIVTFYLFNFYRIFTEYAAIGRLSRVSHWLLTYPPPSPQKTLFITSHNSLSKCQFEISAHIRLNSALVMGCLRVFMVALSKVFRKASLSLMKEQVSRLAKSAESNIFSYFVSEFGYTDERLIPGSRRKAWIFASFVFGSNKSLASQSSIGFRDEIYSARWKLMLILDQAKDLVKHCSACRALCLLFNRWFTSWILNKSTV